MTARHRVDADAARDEATPAAPDEERADAAAAASGTDAADRGGDGGTDARTSAGRPGGGPRIGLVAALVAVVALAMGAGAFLASQRDDGDTTTAADDREAWQGVLLAEPQPRPDFTLTDTSGQPFDFRAETQGKLTLLFFGYTHCPDVCPIHMANLSAALAQPGMPDPIVVFVTTDPERDTPERLRSWLDNFDPDFIGLTGTREEIAAAERAAGVAGSIVPTDTSGDYEVGHAAQIIAYTPDDLAHLHYPFGVRRQDWQADLPRMLEVWGDAPAATDAEVAGAGDGAEAAADGTGVVEVGDVRVRGAWAAADDVVTAVYLTIENGGEDDRVVEASSEVAGHVSTMGGDVDMSADHGSHEGHGDHGAPFDLPVPSGTTELAPGGTHIMLEQLNRPLEPGETITLRLTFEGAGTVEVPVEILDWEQVAERVSGA